MSGILKAVEELINKAQGYTQHTGKGGPAEAVAHNIQGAPSDDESDKEKNAANSGTHPKAGGGEGTSGEPAGSGADFKDSGPEEDEIQTPKGAGGRAPVARPETIKHEGGGTGPNHPGTATATEGQQKSKGSSDLEKSEDDDKDDKDDEEKHEKKEGYPEPDKDDAKKSEDSGEVYLDIDEFTTEIVAKAIAQLDEKYSEFVEQTIQKSNESEYVEAGLAKSIAVTLDRIEYLEKSNKELETAIVNIANTMNIRKSLLKSADNIKGIDNPSLSKSTLSKGEISSRLLDMQMQGNQGVDTNMVLRFDAVGDTSILPELVRSKLGLE